MIKIVNPEDCCGCSACKSVCPKQAISMEPDVLGFLYPKVDLNACVNCGMCEKVCSFNDHYDCSLNLVEPQVFGARHKNIREVETSRSGAAFIALSDWILDNGGVVYGAGYKGHFVVAHKRATTKRERDEFKGSKYVQSDMGDVFCQVRTDLEKGKLVLFSGTGCQVAGLSSFVGKKYRENLYLVDIVCHGVPSPFIWQDYLNYLEKKKGQLISAVNFRDKSKFGWAAHKETFKFIDSYSSDIWTYIFYQHIMLRHSCGVCHFANTKRPGDITIADFWGWEKTNAKINIDDKGCSLLLCNTKKGLDWFEKCQNDLNWFSAKLADCIQPNLQKPTKINDKRMCFERDYEKWGFKYILFRYGNKNPLVRARKMISLIKKIFRRII